MAGLGKLCCCKTTFEEKSSDSSVGAETVSNHRPRGDIICLQYIDHRDNRTKGW